MIAADSIDCGLELRGRPQSTPVDLQAVQENARAPFSLLVASDRVFLGPVVVVSWAPSCLFVVLPVCDLVRSWNRDDFVLRRLA